MWHGTPQGKVFNRPHHVISVLKEKKKKMVKFWWFHLAVFVTVLGGARAGQEDARKLWQPAKFGRSFSMPTAASRSLLQQQQSVELASQSSGFERQQSILRRLREPGSPFAFDVLPVTATVPENPSLPLIEEIETFPNEEGERQEGLDMSIPLPVVQEPLDEIRPESVASVDGAEQTFMRSPFEKMAQENQDRSSAYSMTLPENPLADAPPQRILSWVTGHTHLFKLLGRQLISLLNERDNVERFYSRQFMDRVDNRLEIVENEQRWLNLAMEPIRDPSLPYHPDRFLMTYAKYRKQPDFKIAYKALKQFVQDAWKMETDLLEYRHMLAPFKVAMVQRGLNSRAFPVQFWFNVKTLRKVTKHPKRVRQALKSAAQAFNAVNQFEQRHLDQLTIVNEFTEADMKRLLGSMGIQF